ncbi:response regulator transcription factor [Deinococcus radiotolerans]|uniref:HTH luxR-type domain-containing protein n=1 Tax=Deinococcus radiotolerans TaxID=1309407 RepID=A0ABQ2FEY7_9DEIO|nr:response regulator transcription factor [Deinococcus radiotolerans]GGK89599.1 hypothetical protein GCM10010844_05180 [Deinococcus radiotolerans]
MTADSAPPTVLVTLGSAVLAAGVRTVLGGAGLAGAPEGADPDVLLVDDSWLDDPAPLDGAAVVSLGSRAWAEVLPDLCPHGWACLPADATPAELIAAVHGAAAGLVTLPPAWLVAPEGDDGLDAGDVSLTPRERDVLALLAEGLSNKRAARDLGVSESTVKFHVQALYSKLGVQSRAGAVARGIALGLITV